MDHKVDIEYEGGYAQAAIDLSNLRYDSLRNFLNILGEKLYNDSRKEMSDRESSSLFIAAVRLQEAASKVAKAWEISEVHQLLPNDTSQHH